MSGRRLPRRQVFLALVEALDIPAADIADWSAAWERVAGSHFGVDARHVPTDLGARVVTHPLDPHEPKGIWHFTDRQPVTLVCAQLPDELRRQMPYSDPQDPDYVEILSYADPDALLELYGHVRALNPQVEVRFSTTVALRPDDYMTHVVILGGTDFSILTRELLPLLELPFRMEFRQSEQDPGGFAVKDTDGVRRFSPVVDDTGGGQLLREDVALFFRGLNPFNAKCTITICAGMYARGTLAAVRSLTDPLLRNGNESYCRDRFGRSSAFGILARARVANRVVMPPDWSVPENRLYEWSS